MTDSENSVDVAENQAPPGSSQFLIERIAQVLGVSVDSLAAPHEVPVGNPAESASVVAMCNDLVAAFMAIKSEGVRQRLLDFARALAADQT